MKDVSIQYLGGSGFFVSISGTGLLFDASERGADRREMPTKEALDGLDRLFVFVSHHHETHFSPAIYALCGGEATYILGYDVPEPHEGLRMRPGEEKNMDGVRVRAYGSTDEGVSFLVECGGVRLFHAGDLNLWHWRDESSIAQINSAEKAFYDCVAEIPREEIDIAFFPVDPRQGSMYDAGAGYFVMTVKPRVFIPMHFQGRDEAAIRFASTGGTSSTQIVALGHAGERVELHMGEEE